MTPDRMTGVSPETALRFAFRRIAVTRMAGLPFLNPFLEVDAIGFRDWEGKRVGVLVTPWSINLVAFPAGDETLRVLGPDQSQTWNFPAGSYTFMGGDEPECGPYQFCSLFSPAQEFVSHDDAVATARAVLDNLFTDPATLAEQTLHTKEKREAAHLLGKPAPLSRRAFLFGRGST